MRLNNSIVADYLNGKICMYKALYLIETQEERERFYEIIYDLKEREIIKIDKNKKCELLYLNSVACIVVSNMYENHYLIKKGNDTIEVLDNRILLFPGDLIIYFFDKVYSDVVIVNRANESLYGYVIKAEDNDWKLILEDKKEMLRIKNGNCFNVTEKDYVEAKYIYDENNCEICCEIVKNLSVENKKNFDNSFSFSLGELLRERKISLNFSERCVREAKELEKNILLESCERVDLTNELTFTIDESDSKDLDDAITILKNGEFYNLKIHISDVSSYVARNGSVDKEALKRSTSIYLPGRVINMLPEKLAEDKFSLLPNIVRKAITVDLLLNSIGEVVEKKLYLSNVVSKARLNYSQLDVYYQNYGLIDFDFKNELKEALNNSYNLASILKKKREAEGAIFIEQHESKIILNSYEEPIDITLKNRGITRKIVQQFMILANEEIAKSLYYGNLPCIYRINLGIESNNLEYIKDRLKKLKIIDKVSDVKEINEIMRVVFTEKENEKYRLYTNHLIGGNLKKAEYSTINNGHYGINTNAYCHFTSPVRRYVDLENQRLLKEFVINKSMNCASLSKEYAHLDNVAHICTNNERNVQGLVAEYKNKLIFEYLKKNYSCTYDAEVLETEDYEVKLVVKKCIDGVLKIGNKEKVNQFKIGDCIKVKFSSMSDGIFYFERG